MVKALVIGFEAQEQIGVAEVFDPENMVGRQRSISVTRHAKPQIDDAEHLVRTVGGDEELAVESSGTLFPADVTAVAGWDVCFIDRTILNQIET